MLLREEEELGVGRRFVLEGGFPFVVIFLVDSHSRLHGALAVGCDEFGVLELGVVQ